MLHVAHIGAVRNQRRHAAEHAVPHRTRRVVGGVTGTQQVAFEWSPQQRERLLTDPRLGHSALNATIGSIRAARRAGNTVASTATAAPSTVADTRIIGSAARTS